jgi:hypothetical protein
LLLAQLNLASATVAGANLTSNTAVVDSGGMHVEGTELLSLSAIDFINSTVTEGGSASAALWQVYMQVGRKCKRVQM